MLIVNNNDVKKHIYTSLRYYILLNPIGLLEIHNDDKIYNENEIEHFLYDIHEISELPKFKDILFGDPNSTIGIVLQHGYIGSNIENLYLGSKLALIGYRVIIPLLPGHGKNYTALHQVNSTKWKKKTQTAIEFLKQEKSDRKIILIGHSIGGVINLQITSTRNDIAAVCTISSPFTYPKIVHLAAKLISSIYPNLLIKYRMFKFYDKKLSQHPYVKYLRKYYGVVTIKSLKDVIELLEETKNCLKKIKSPVLIIQSELDSTIYLNSGFNIKKFLGSKQKYLIYLKKSYHLGIIDTDRENVFQLILQFFNITGLLLK